MTAKKWLDSVEKQKRIDWKEQRDKQMDGATDRQSQRQKIIDSQARRGVNNSATDEKLKQTIGWSKLPTLPTSDLTAILCSTSPIYRKQFSTVVSAPFTPYNTQAIQTKAAYFTEILKPTRSLWQQVHYQAQIVQMLKSITFHTQA